MKRLLCSDAGEMLPSRLLISIAIIATIVVLLGCGMRSLQIVLAEHQVELGCREVQSALSVLVQSGGARDLDSGYSPEGSKRMVTLTLPSSLVYLSLGGDPDPQQNGSRTSTLLEDGAVIVYKVSGGSKQVIWLPKETYRLREGILQDGRWMMNEDGQSVVVTHGGTVSLVFELVKQNQKNYILIENLR